MTAGYLDRGYRAGALGALAGATAANEQNADHTDENR